MTGFDRSKIKATPMSVLKKQEEEIAAVRPQGGGDREWIQHSIKETGKHTFRFFPFHPDGGGESYGEARCISYLQVTRPKRDADKKVIEGEFEIKSHPVFNAKVHGGYSKDLVEEYMNFAKDTAIPALIGEDAEKGKRIWKEIVGDYMDKSIKNQIKPQDSTVVYCTKLQKDGTWSKVGRLEFPKSVKQQLIEEAIKFSSGDDSTPDPFTDPDMGIAVIIENSGSGTNRYSVSLESKREGMNLSYVPTPLTNEQLEEWSKLDPLYKMYKNSYKRTDFNMQLEGLQNFDQYLASKGYPIQVFGYDEFLDIVQEIESQLPEEGAEEGEKQPEPKPAAVATKPTPSISKPVVQRPAPVKQTTQAPTPVVTKAINRLDEIKAKFGKK